MDAVYYFPQLPIEEIANLLVEMLIKSKKKIRAGGSTQLDLS
jgi:hypothetical protein